MEKNKEVEAELKAHAFVCNGVPSEWTKDDWTIRFYGDEMEIYESVQPDGNGRYLLIDLSIDLDTLRELLDYL